MPPCQLLAGLGHRSDSTERPPYDARQPSRCEGLMLVVEPPLSAGERASATDPDRSVSHANRRLQSCHSISLSPVFAAELGRERNHNDLSTHGFNNGTRASL